MAQYFAMLSQINYGIVSSCYCASIIVNSTVGYFVYKEKMTPKMIAGMGIIIGAIVWISLAKGKPIGSANSQSDLSETEKDFYKVISIFLAIMVGVANASITVHSKHLMIRHKYPPLEMASEGSLAYCFIAMIIIAYGKIVVQEEGINEHNLMVGTMVGLLAMICVYVG